MAGANGALPGLECRACGCRHFYVIYTRRRAGRIIRRRECRNCGRRLSTVERIVFDSPRSD